MQACATPAGPVDVSADGRRAPCGYGGAAPWTASYLGLDDIYDDAGLVLALPRGSRDGRRVPSWNARLTCCHGNEPDDAAYLVALTERLKSRYAIDPRRVYVVGHSNGGYMAHRLSARSIATATRFPIRAPSAASRRGRR